MPSQSTRPSPPKDAGTRIFIAAAYPARYNFAVANYNLVSTVHKRCMRGGRLLLFRSVVAVCWIISMAFALLALIRAPFIVPTVLICVFYLVLSAYNLYVFVSNGSLMKSSRFLRAKAAGPAGLDHEWVMVPLESRSANERLSMIEQSTLDDIRREFAGNRTPEIDCFVYTSRYANNYPTFPKEMLLHFFAFLCALTAGSILALV
jgi:hypothetical protein